MSEFNRRTFVFGTAVTVGAVALGGRAGAALPYPFKLGVASGDPLPDGVVLWTRLAPDPLENGNGGMPTTSTAVDWEVATDDKFTNVVKKGQVTALYADAHSVHVEVNGLQPDYEYYYRFRAAGHISPVGRTRTTPAFDTFGRDLLMAFTSCAHYEDGFYTVYRRMAEDRPGLILHLGDYIYETTNDPDDPRPRRHRIKTELTKLDHYRQRYAEYKMDADLQAAHAVAPWLVVPDDHEVENNYAAGKRSNDKPSLPDGWAKRRADAYKAYYENMPLRGGAKPNGDKIQLYRRVRWGRLATFHMLDTRQYRSDQACGDGWKYCPEAGDPARSLPGIAQENWLLDGFSQRQGTWDVIGQQVFFARRADANGASGMDGWDGYPASRDRVQKGWVQRGVRNPVVLTGDVHRAWANELKVDYTNPGSPVVGTELVTSSVSSGGDETDTTGVPDQAGNPHLKFYSKHRGYVRAKLSQTKMDVDFRAVKKVTVRGEPATTLRSYVIEEGRPGLQAP
ncbi:alkaline phosphatase D family protein [Amycolatopsis regifaucium]|uniref:Alkaline phosphatase n=1 Tax=Amycolatopsis regifaucium TaxID=546365 RepID=A0A154MUK0_9PSEU|nr:alkaline phosphatase D family protein [Amycolatopsis regifaucium]KZB88024.1 alkaline phosphatase [Amycolatopsis regifaucium]OKA04473.1 alkaline phosphatase [Amycolatopsis regifaucium]SFH49797.1 alkaline phosphatase D [Amycolatopsis regifaucium]